MRHRPTGDPLGELAGLDESSDLYNELKAMRPACRRFLDRTQFPDGSSGPFRPRFHPFDLEGQTFFTALGELQGAFGIHVARIAVQPREESSGPAPAKDPRAA